MCSGLTSLVNQYVGLPGPAVGPTHGKRSAIAHRVEQVSRVGAVPLPFQAHSDTFSNIHS